MNEEEYYEKTYCEEHDTQYDEYCEQCSDEFLRRVLSKVKIEDQEEEAGFIMFIISEFKQGSTIDETIKKLK